MELSGGYNNQNNWGGGVEMILIFPLSLSFQHLYRPIVLFNLYTLNVFYTNENDILLHFFPHAYYVLNFNITSPL